MDRLKHGQRRGMRLRRIDANRAVVLPEQTAVVVDVRKLRHQFERTEREIEVLRKNLEEATARAEVLRGYLTTFASSPIVRDDDDPSVETPAPDEPTTDEPAAPEG